MVLPQRSAVATRNPPRSAYRIAVAAAGVSECARNVSSVASVWTTITNGENCHSVQKAAVDAALNVSSNPQRVVSRRCDTPRWIQVRSGQVTRYSVSLSTAQVSTSSSAHRV